MVVKARLVGQGGSEKCAVRTPVEAGQPRNSRLNAGQRRPNSARKVGRPVAGARRLCPTVGRSQ